MPVWAGCFALGDGFYQSAKVGSALGVLWRVWGAGVWRELAGVACSGVGVVGGLALVVVLVLGDWWVPWTRVARSARVDWRVWAWDLSSSATLADSSEAAALDWVTWSI